MSDTRDNFNKSGANRNMFQVVAKFDGVPRGYGPGPDGGAWVIPQKAGGMASFNNVNGLGTISNANEVSGINLLANLSGTGTISNADLNLIIALAAALSGSGTISNAALDAIASMAATLAGQGLITDAALSSIVGMTAALSGSGTIAGDFIGALYMEADLTPFTELSPQSLAAAILDDSDVEAGDLTVREALRLIVASLAGKISGAETTTITIRNAVADDKNRIVATVDSNGNRTAITYDLGD